MAGTKACQHGAVTVLGADMKSAAAREHVSTRIAYLPQGLGRALYPTLSVAENLGFFARLFGLPDEERAARTARLLRATGLDPFPDRQARKLSGGMRQKLALCCALIHDPDLLILDEPTTGIDPLSRRRFWALIEELRQERPGMTVIVATAYMEEAERFETVIALEQGQVLAAEPTAQLLSRMNAGSLDEAYVRLKTGHGGAKIERIMLPPRVKRDGAPAILAENITRKFGDFIAVDRVSFRIERGEVFGFLGSNGCGKTTTMKMLTGLLRIDQGHAELLGRPISAADAATRMRVGYMSQSFSLYEELSVEANLRLHAHLYRMEPDLAAARIAHALEHFGLDEVRGQKPLRLPLGIRQRLQLAVACLHRPEVLILDEPTSGVDPAARESFWRLLGELSRKDGVTIFISTHFMNEAERCDRVSLMDAGKVLAMGSPAELCHEYGAAALEEVFITLLERAGERSGPETSLRERVEHVLAAPAPGRSKSEGTIKTSFNRIRALAWREATEMLRDPIRLAFALLGPVILLITFGYGISFDVEHLPFAVLDQDHSPESRHLVEGFTASRYFDERAPLRDEADIDRRLHAGEIKLALHVPAGFGRELLAGRRPELAFYLDGAMPFRAETARGYATGVMSLYFKDLARREVGTAATRAPITIESRFRYNQDFRSAVAITPGIIMILLILFMAMLTALSVVREKETGSISNLYASPATIGEFLLGKQLPYLALGLASFVTLILIAVFLFDLSIKGSPGGLLLGAFLYIFAGSGFGLLISSFVRTQVAAILVAAILTTVFAINFSGYLFPAATLEGLGRVLGLAFPALWFQNIALGTLAKGGSFGSFGLDYLMLFGFGVFFLLVTRLILRKQER
jgi:ribosome-dependent ATPase